MNSTTCNILRKKKKTLSKRKRVRLAKNSNIYKAKDVISPKNSDGQKQKKNNSVKASSDCKPNTNEVNSSNTNTGSLKGKSKKKKKKLCIEPERQDGFYSDTDDESDRDISNLLSFGGNVELKQNAKNKFARNPYANDVPDDYGIFDRNVNVIPDGNDNKKDEPLHNQELCKDLLQDFTDEEQSSVTETEPTNVSVCIFLVPPRNSVVLLLEQGASVTLEGMVNVSVISGVVSVHGVELSYDMPAMPIYSFVKICCLKLEAKSSENVWKSHSTLTQLKDKLKAVTSPNTANEILAKVSNSSVVIRVERVKIPLPLNFVFMYSSRVIQRDDNALLANVNLQNYGFSIRKSDEDVASTVIFKPLASEVLNLIQTSKIYNTPGPRFLVYGSKNVGKSTLLRYLINVALQKYEKVMYLDTDLGQTEFCVPGTVSLVEVTEPLLGGPFTHRKDSLMSLYIGNVTIEESPEMYKKGIETLMEFYTSEYSSFPLFINTMGWIEGIGAICLTEVIKSSRPTLAVELIPIEKRSVYSFKDDSSDPAIKKKLCFTVPKAKRITDDNSTNRELMILSYFGQCQKSYDLPRTLNAFEPYCISWKHLALYVFYKHVPPEKLPHAMNASLVALCNVDESLMLESSVPSFPKTLEQNPVHNCLGFGIVRAIDVSKKLFYIITPLPLEKLQQVNALLKGNIVLPPSLFLKQNIDCVPLPYVKVVIDNLKPQAPGEKFIPRRKRFLRQ